MAIKKLDIQLRGISPLIMHKYNLQQPTEPRPPRMITQAYIDARRKKDWLEHAYWDAEMGFFIPGENVDSAIRDGAKRQRRGKDIQAFCVCEEPQVPLVVYRGPDDTKGAHLNGKLEKYYVPEHIDLRGVCVPKGSGNRIDRCRAIFRQWGLRFTLNYDDEFLDLEALGEALRMAALGDYRPRFGRFRTGPMKEL